MNIKPLFFLACGLAVVGCADPSPPPTNSQSAEIQPIPQTEEAQIRAGNLHQDQQKQRLQNVINTIRYLGVGGIN
ncbi:MAG TPA: hypothetical protein VMA37_10965 [Acetobacteraceae bacterium]|nr:hypothetical protein [Acetobacteraceae bacterium]